MSAQGQQFEVLIQSNTIPPEEWFRAMSAPKSELPELSQEQREAVRKLDISEEEYARTELARRYGREGLRRRGERFGAIIQRLLQELGGRGRVIALVYEGGKSRWVVRIELPSGLRNLAIPEELVDDVLDSELYESIQAVKQKLRAGLE